MSFNRHTSTINTAVEGNLEDQGLPPLPSGDYVVALAEAKDRKSVV